MDNKQLEHNEYQREIKQFPLCLLAHDMEVPMNVGSLFRIADAFGVEKIYLTGNSPVPPNRKIRKTSRATENAVAYESKQDVYEVINELKQKGYLIVSLEITSNSTDINVFCKNKMDKVCLIVGSENKGVDADLLSVSDHVVHIPMFGQNSSMNVATASSVAVFEIIKTLV